MRFDRLTLKSQEGVRDGTARVARGCHQNRQLSVAFKTLPHDPRHEPRTDILEGERRPMKELQQLDSFVDPDQGNREVEGIVHHSIENMHHSKQRHVQHRQNHAIRW